MQDVFVSYISEDHEYVQQLIEAIEIQGYTVDYSSTPLDDLTPHSLTHHIVDVNRYQVLVPFVSKHSAEAPLLKAQLHIASGIQMPTIPIVSPSLSDKKLPSQVKRIQYYRVKGNGLPDDKFFKTLGEEISKDIDEHTTRQIDRLSATITRSILRETEPLTFEFLVNATSDFTEWISSDNIDDRRATNQMLASLKMLELLCGKWLRDHGLEVYEELEIPSIQHIKAQRVTIGSLSKQVIKNMVNERNKSLDDVPMSKISDKNRAQRWVNEGLIDSVEQVYEELTAEQEEMRQENIRSLQKNISERNRSDTTLDELQLGTTTTSEKSR